MKKPLELEVNLFTKINIEDLVSQISRNDCLALIEQIDLDNADIDFTLAIILSRIESLKEDIENSGEWKEVKERILAALGESKSFEEYVEMMEESALQREDAE